ncbi:MAG: quinone oxidoreductase family protein [Pseudonocardiaceae bacterium]
MVDVLATGLHPRLRSDVAGTHYASDGFLPLVPGFDGVGRTPDGERVFFADLAAPHGSMAQRVNVPADRLIRVPDEISDHVVAGAMNPAMSAWVALTQRAGFRLGERVLVLGATGTAGQLAVQLAKHLGASQIIGTGRDQRALDKLCELGVEIAIPLRGGEHEIIRALGSAAADVDIVVDYLWGKMTELALAAITSARPSHAHRLRWVHVGSMSGATITLPGATLRKTNLEICGSGRGSVSLDNLYSANRELLHLIPVGKLRIDIIAMPLADIEQAWNRTVPTGTRIVLTP